MSRRARRSFTPEFRANAVELVRSSGKPIGQIAKDLDLTESALRAWVKADAQAGSRQAAQVTETEREELRRLRDENRTLKMERDFLKKAAAFFAKESK